MGEMRGGGGGGLLGRRLGRLRPAEDSRDCGDEGGKAKAECERCNCFHSVRLQQFCIYWTSQISNRSDFYLDGDLAGGEEVDDSSEVLL